MAYLKTNKDASKLNSLIKNVVVFCQYIASIIFKRKTIASDDLVFLSYSVFDVSFISGFL